MSDPSPPPAQRGPTPGLLPVCALHAVALGSYGIVAPAAQSLFLGAFEAAVLPWAWVGVMVAAMGAVLLIRALARRLPPSRCLAIAAALNAATLTALLCCQRQQAPWASFVMFIWRDVYILVLLELFWMHINLSALAQQAARLYGPISAAGTVGAVVVGAVGAALSQRLGTLTLLATMVPMLLLAAALAWRLPPTAQVPGAAPSPPPHEASPPGAAAAGRWRPRPIYAIFAVVAVGHVCLTLLDFQFSQTVQQHLPDADHRTKIIGGLQAGTNLLSVVLQAACGPLMRRLSLVGSLAATPLVLAGSMSVYALVGGLVPVACAKSLTKGLDHSLYRTSKELLYLPLSYQDKTAGKAWVDIAGSRLAKAVASIFLLACGAMHCEGGVMPTTLVAVGLWAVLAVWVAGGHRRRGRAPG